MAHGGPTRHQPPPKFPMSPEMAASMIEDIREVYPVSEREIREPGLPPEHIAQIPAGHKRDEEVRRREDDLQQRQEEGVNLGDGDETHPIDQHKLQQQDNEILNFAEFEGPNSGSCPVTNPVHGYRYLWVPQWDSGGSERVIAHLQNVRQTIVQLGYERVEGNMPECMDMKAVGGVRRWGDCVLYRIKMEQYAKLEKYREHLLRRQGAVEQGFEAYGQQYADRLGGNMAHGDPRDPMIQRTVFAGAAGQQVAIQREIRTGRVIPGFGGRR